MEFDRMVEAYNRRNDLQRLHFGELIAATYNTARSSKDDPVFTRKDFFLLSDEKPKRTRQAKKSEWTLDKIAQAAQKHSKPTTWQEQST